MKKSILSQLVQISLLALLSYACTKDTAPIPPVPPAPPVVVAPVPPPAPVEPTKYGFTLENISTQTITTYNDDPAKPKENYKETTLLPAQKTTIQILSETGTTPTIRPSNPLSQTEYLFSPGSKTYQLNSYLNQMEVRITGDVGNITIDFPNPITGKPDTLRNVKLPQTIQYSKAAGEVVIIAEKQQVGGTFTLQTFIKDKEVYSKSVTAPFGKLTTKAKVGDNSVSASLYEPAEWPCGTHNGNRLITGPKGGCYYINKNGNKTYVDRSECNCN